ncbi:MAG: Uma2 family endonuclease [Thiohalocapsa sp. PB-PSB1]|jgi:Uma2 family endonuclease|nr:MAG: Uma2 family endonuclease [Thiohalocapsa sp. PB-PSB1]
MKWQEVCEDPRLKDLPYKIELNEYGKILMSPQKVYHSIFQGKIQNILRKLNRTGEVFPECAISTVKGTKVADVVWVSEERYHIIKREIECSISPELCVEIISSSNTQEEMEEKKGLYFGQGAKEFWLCDENGDITFFNHSGQLGSSSLVPNFPNKIDL